MYWFDKKNEIIPLLAPSTEFLRSLPDLPPRESQGHKGTYGLAILVGGSLGMSGSIALSGMAAQITGAGLVRLGVPRSILSTVAGFAPEYTTVPLPEDAKGLISATAIQEITHLLQFATVGALGPGMGRSTELNELVNKLFLEVPKPLVLDADAINALAEENGFFGDIRAGRPLNVPAAARIFTPHPGEFQRMTGIPTPRTTEERQQVALDFVANIHQQFQQGGSQAAPCILLLKGAETVVTDGQSVFVNKTGNPGMATGGCGDVLTGVITALIAQGLSPFEATCLGAALHGLAGDCAAAIFPMESIIASDLVRFFPAALTWFRTIREKRAVPNA